MNSLISWYQCKIGAYDLQIWEKAVELQEQQNGGMKSMDKRSSSARSDLIDIDLVRGSTFSKNKPQFSWFIVICQGLVRVVFLPMFYKWWIQQTTKGIAMSLIFLYLLHGFTSYLYFTAEEKEIKHIPVFEVIMPIFYMLILGMIHCQVVSTNFRPCSTAESHRNRRYRTLSSALLEPVVSGSHQTTLSFVASSVRPVNAGTIPDLELRQNDTDKTSKSENVNSSSLVVIGRQRKNFQTGDTEFIAYNDGNAREKRNNLSMVEHGVVEEIKYESAHSEDSKHVCHEDPRPLVDSLSKEQDSIVEDGNCARERKLKIYWENSHSSSSGSDSSRLTEESESDNSNADSCTTSVEEEIKQSGNLSATALLPCPSPTVDRIGVRMWENNQCKKIQASLLDIGCIIRRKVQESPMTSEFFVFGLCYSLFIAHLSVLYRTFTRLDMETETQRVASFNEPSLITFLSTIERSVVLLIHGKFACFRATFIVYAVILQRFALSFAFFFMLCVAHTTFKQRFLLAKYFSHLTSSRRAKRSDLPHFRLDRIENVRLWLSLRAYLRRRGPQRSVDVIVSSAFFLSLCLLCFISVQLLHDTEQYMSSLIYWEMTVWLLALAIFLLSFMTIGAQINTKYSNVSILLTEQINLYLQMKRKPNRRDELQRANSVLSIAAKLIKDMESPFNIYGLAMNPLLYNITRVVVLSAFSGVISEILGFKLKIWKIKP